MEEPITEINQSFKDMQINEEVSEDLPPWLLGELPPFYSDGSTVRDFLIGLGVDVDEVLNPAHRANPSYPPILLELDIVWFLFWDIVAVFKLLAQVHLRTLLFPVPIKHWQTSTASTTRTINLLKAITMHIFVRNFIWDASVSIATSLLSLKQNPSRMGIFTQETFLLMQTAMLIAPLLLFLTPSQSETPQATLSKRRDLQDSDSQNAEFDVYCYYKEGHRRL